MSKIASFHAQANFPQPSKKTIFKLRFHLKKTKQFNGGDEGEKKLFFELIFHLLQTMTTTSSTTVMCGERERSERRVLQ